jgi:guanylate kinase
MTPGEFYSIDEDNRKKCFVVYLDIYRSVRESRLFKREDRNDSIIRRLEADDIDFQSYNDYDLKITDPEFTADDVYDLMD